jgi:poly-gamma-glutamate capsule biosynthesis protein CapA/YwtB (metallophosphatase superfamily)
MLRIAVFLFIAGCAVSAMDPARADPTRTRTPWANPFLDVTPASTPAGTNGDSPPTAEPSATDDPTPSPFPSGGDEPGSVTLAIVGDIMLGRSLADRIVRGDGASIFASVEPILQSADVAVGNLECALGEGGTRAPKYYTFLAPPESAAVMKDAGFDLLSLANNHSFDYGLEVFRQSLQLFDQVSIRYVGAGFNEGQARAPVIYDLHGIRVAFLAYVEVPAEFIGGFDPKVWSAGPETPGVSWAEDDKIKQDLLSLDPKVDYLVVLFHYGEESIDIPNERQVQLSQMAIDYGADLVVGAHTHVLQRSEEYQDGWIYYNLGNFVFDEFYGKLNRSAILWVTITKGAPAEHYLIPLTIVDGVPYIGE